MPGWSRHVRRRIHRLVTEGDVDLWLLAGAAALFTILGIVGVASESTLSSAVLALLAFMATAQIRSRRDVASIAASNRVEPTDLLSANFPQELASKREQSQNVLLIGVALSRTIQTYREHLVASLKAGAWVRVMVLDPDLHDLMSRRWAALGQPVASGGRRRIENTLAELTEIRDSTNGRLEIRVSAHWPAAGFNALDTGSTRGQIVVQHYEFAAPGEPAPVISLAAGDGPWYLHFVAEAERMWAAGLPWPLSPATRLAVSTAPGFVESLGNAPVEAIVGADEVLISGVSRNALFLSNYRIFEAALARGCRIRVVLLDPDSLAVDIAADRGYAVRSAETLRARIRHTQGQIAALAAAGGNIKLRLTKHPLAIGAVATTKTGAEPLAFFVYYTHQAPGEPKFILKPSDGPAYEALLREAELLWDAATPTP